MAVVLLDELPTPDAFGNYWLREANGQRDISGPAILPSKRLDDSGNVVHSGRWLLSLGDAGGVLFDRGGKMMTWKSPAAAWRELRKRRRR